ncbi:MAG TPA: hypothetical protein VEY30_07215, partial [Myxococcaceae bacterium]|nr:hypothetical protein [Myxococcaceae bacterium]
MATSVSAPEMKTFRLFPDGSLDARLWAKLKAELERAGLAHASLRHQADAVISLYGGGPLPSRSERSVLLFDGQLLPEHGALFADTTPPLLVAGRDPEGAPAAWEWEVLRALVSGLPLAATVCDRQVFRRTLRQLSDVGAVSQEVQDLILSTSGRRAVAQAAADVMHELAANALLDAPADAAGAPRYAHRRGEGVRIDPQDAAEVTFGTSAQYVFLEAVDRFGRMTAAPWGRAVSALGGRLMVNADGGGAGLGLIRVLEHG